MNDNKTIQPTDDKTETDYQPEVSKIAKRGKNQNLFIFLIIALLAVAFLGYSFLNKKDTQPAQVKEKEEFGTTVRSKTFTAPPAEIPAILNPEPQPMPTATAPVENHRTTEALDMPSAPRLIKGLSPGTIDGETLQAVSDVQNTDTTDTVTNQPPNLLLAKGTFIQCSLRTKLVSTVAGNLGCVVANDVYSANGTVLLIEKGSTVFGEFRNGQIQQGEERLFVVWSEIRTPKNIIININSGATDELGGTGIPGYVDNHFWERFGNAIMLSMITDSTSALSTQLAKRGTFNPTDTVQAGSEIAQSILEKTINIPPTLYKNQGDLVGIFVARDIDFGDVYELKQK
ncbi:type IV secretion system protein VirB10 [Aggregatibacter actinomycetemcomitans]|uniref:type IV secretion system protein VirB10 n=1 Tax=Aggregatibacter actinomycetemcomitans TaxID=714 RepID=UPI0006A739A9|nr:type IV secretion system protein VirB10 [Aggregatibacter actinomycetemcomitans]KOE52049.1 conjugal transfer protein TrbI [Aggregatibacter actinomycetemcomitans serotype b str. S23A]